jgi:hypothetical protein
MKKVSFFKWFVLALVLLALAACGGIGMGSRTTGSLHIVLGEMRAQQILPDESMDLDHYILSGSGPTPFGPLTVSGSTLVESLLPGAYTIGVEAFNSLGTKIAAGSNTAAVSIGITTPVTIDVLEDSGLGHMALTAAWTGAPVVTPVIDSYLRSGAGSDSPLTWTLGTNSATYAGDWQNSWYILVFKLSDDTMPIGGFVEAVRLAEGLTTTGVCNFVTDAATGELDINIILSMYDPIAITSNIPAGDFTFYADQTFSASVAPGDAGGLFTWWIDGEQVAVDVASYAIDWDSLDETLHYRLDLTYILADGSGAGHVSWNLIKETMPLEAYTIGLTARSATSGNYILRIYDMAGAVVATQPFDLVEYVNELIISPQLAPGSYKASVFGTAEVWNGGADFASAAAVEIPQLPAYRNLEPLWVN